MHMTQITIIIRNRAATPNGGGFGLPCRIAPDTC